MHVPVMHSWPDARSEYPRRIAIWSEAIARGERIHNLVSNLRLAAAGTGAAVAWLAFVRDAVSPLWTLAPLAARDCLAPDRDAARVFGSSVRPRVHHLSLIHI